MACKYIRVNVRSAEGPVNTLGAIKLDNGKVYAWTFNLLFDDKYAARTLVRKIENGEYPRLRLVEVEPDIYMFASVYVNQLREQGIIPPKEGAHKPQITTSTTHMNIKQTIYEAQKYIKPIEPEEKIKELMYLIDHDGMWRQYCTDHQISVIETLIKNDCSLTSTAKALRTHEVAIYQTLFGCDRDEDAGALMRIFKKHTPVGVTAIFEFAKEFQNYRELLGEYPKLVHLIDLILKGENFNKAAKISGYDQDSGYVKKSLTTWAEKIRQHGTLRIPRSDNAFKLLEIVQKFPESELFEIVGKKRWQYLETFLETKSIVETANICQVSTSTVSKKLFKEILPELELLQGRVTI